MEIILARSLIVAALFLLIGCSPSSPVDTAGTGGISMETTLRLELWKSLITMGTDWSDQQRLTVVNDFINELDFVEDIQQWSKDDYWATPLETLVSRGGDCEDFAIAKYFTLIAMGIEKDKMRLTYAKTVATDEAHLVVTYHEKGSHEPLVLDNIDLNITRSSQREDLLPIYSFNVEGIWLEKREKSAQYVAQSSRLALWNELLKKMDVEASDDTEIACLYQSYDLLNPIARTNCTSSS